MARFGQIIASIAFLGTACAVNSQAQDLYGYSGDAYTPEKQAGDEALKLAREYEICRLIRDTDCVMELFAPASTAAWRDGSILTTEEDRRSAFDDELADAKERPAFDFSTVNLQQDGQVAVVQTFNPPAATLFVPVEDKMHLVRDTFIVERVDGEYKIVYFEPGASSPDQLASAMGRVAG